jgi:hypothetical protein
MQMPYRVVGTAFVILIGRFVQLFCDHMLRSWLGDHLQLMQRIA